MKKILAFIVIFCFTFSCIPTDDETDDGPIVNPNGESSLENLLIFDTGDAKFPYAFVHKNGDRLYTRDADENGVYDGFFYKDGNYEEFLILDEFTGLPKSKRNNEGLLVLYNFKEENKVVDLVFEVNGETSFVRNISVPYSSQTAKSKLQTKSKTDAEEIRNAANAYQLAANIISCAEGIGGFLVGSTLSLGIATVPAALLASAKCSPLVLSGVESLLEATDTEIGQLLANDLEKVNGFISALTCPTGLAGCTAFVVSEAYDLQVRLEELQRKSEALQKELEELLSRSAEVIMVGRLNFGPVELDDTKTEVLEIFNRGTQPITITGLEVNSDADQFQINTPFPFTLEGIGGNAFRSEISVTFAPKDAAGTFNTFLKISNDKYEPFDAKAITATATNEEGAKIRLTGTLNYNGVTLNNPHSEFFDIGNPNLNEDLEISSIEFQGEPSATFKDRFKIIGWNNGTIEPGKKQEVEVVFETPDIEEYSGFLVINNNLDNINNKWPVYGKGQEIPEFEILEEEIIFSAVKIGETSQQKITLKNIDTKFDLVLTGIKVLENTVLNDRFSFGEPFSIKIEPGETADFRVNFEPNYEGTALGELVLLINGVEEATNTKLLGNGYCKDAPLQGIFEVSHPDFGGVVFQINNSCQLVFGGCDFPNAECDYNSMYNFDGNTFSANWGWTEQYPNSEPSTNNFSFSSNFLGEDTDGKFFRGNFTAKLGGGDVKSFENATIRCWTGICNIGF